MRRQIIDCGCNLTPSAAYVCYVIKYCKFLLIYGKVDNSKNLYSITRE